MVLLNRYFEGKWYNVLLKSRAGESKMSYVETAREKKTKLISEGQL